jgi:thiol-disulfide isomerase/thioredoxin
MIFAAAPMLLAAGPPVAEAQQVAMVWHAVPRHTPLFVFTSEVTGPITLRWFRGRVVLLYVWATWCPTCQREMPVLDKLQAQLGGKNFEVVALSIDRGGLDDVEPFYRELGIAHLGAYVDRNRRVMPTLGIVGIPTTLLIDRQGREVAWLKGPADWQAAELVAEIRQFVANGSRPADGGAR